ncbi:LCP family protein [Streptomyces sp. MI02-7b]|uniref:LCP family protein n=1 Tax=Streptomyces sp. MI02-7b TaxID=462941 RepID=UPI0029AB35D9|nr:LCP family protein [Streptomyces sp. MI02-7b]MDX3074783.1 LCP family protein [Streptomyces sp. MI02-7b]
MRHGSAPGGLNAPYEPHEPGWGNAPYRGGDGAPYVPQQPSYGGGYQPQPQPQPQGQGQQYAPYDTTAYQPSAFDNEAYEPDPYAPEEEYEDDAPDTDSRTGGPGDGGGDGTGGPNGPGRRGNRRRKKGKRRALRWVAIVTSLAIVGSAGAAWAYYEHLNANIRKDALNLGDSKVDKSKANAAGQTPLNILLLGSDSRASKENQKLGGAKADATRKPLADVQMLLHVSADRSNMTVVSIPRDTRVTIPKCTDPDDGTVYPETSSETINASLGHGGPGCTVATWENLTGISIDHFMMIDFAGVVSMADAVGGVPVCVKSNVWDKKSGLKLTAGDHVIKGKQALQWLRTRHGFEDGSDIGRTHAQHMYMNAMVRQLKSGTKLTDPGALTGLAESATKALTVDTGLGTVKKLYDMGNDLKRVPTGRITMTTMPWGADPENPTAHVVPTPAATKLFTLLRNDQAVDGKASKKKPPAKPASTARPDAKADIPVTVENGTGTASQAAVPGRAKAISERLVALGYTQAESDSTPQSQSGTTVTYPSDDQQANANALAVAKSLGLPTSAVKKSASASGITLVVGADWTTGTSYPKESSSDTKEVLDSANALNASDKSACMKVNPYYNW